MFIILFIVFFLRDALHAPELKYGTTSPSSATVIIDSMGAFPIDELSAVPNDDDAVTPGRETERTDMSPRTPHSAPSSRPGSALRVKASARPGSVPRVKESMSMAPAGDHQP